MRIARDTFLAEILKNPGAKEILEKFNLPCLSCPMAEQEIGSLKIGEVCRVYNINLVKLLKELNGLEKN
ncbi:MAG: disulfide oxidoreductase [bacterium]